MNGDSWFDLFGEWRSAWADATTPCRRIVLSLQGIFMVACAVFTTLLVVIPVACLVAIVLMLLGVLPHAHW